MKKFGTRETAWVAMVWLLGIATYLILTLPPAQKIQVFQPMVIPVIGLVGGAFGLKIYQGKGEK